MKIAVIGSNRGIGLELVSQLAKEDSNNDIDAFCRTKSSELLSLKTKNVFENFDTTNTEKMLSVLNQVEESFYDQVFVVSGVLHSDSLSDWDNQNIVDQFSVNSLGALNCARLFSAKLKTGGTIGVLSSRMGSISDNSSGGMYGYRMSKAALNAGLKSLSIDLKKDKKSVLILHPGYVQTDMTGHNGELKPSESVPGLIKLMNEKSITETGSFWHTNGQNLNW